jgi:MFS transporter, UMF1 family
MVEQPAPGSLGDGRSGAFDPVGEVGADGVGPSMVASTGFAGLPLGGWAWSMFQGGRDPYVILISIYIFAPYFTGQVVGDPVKGQAMIATMTTVYSLFVALTAPFLGAAIERFGARKPVLLAIVALMAPMIAALWFVTPGGTGIPVGTTLWIFGLIGVLFVYGEVIHNSMLIEAAGPTHAPHASGLALSLGNAVSVITLVFCMGAFALPGLVDWSLIPASPLFGLDRATAEPSRIVAPIAAVLLVVMAIPLFLFTTDAPRSGEKFATSLRLGARGLLDTLKSLKGETDMRTYLLARMLFTDGMTSLLAFGGLYAAGVMQWGVLEMLGYGILLSIFAVIGGFVGAWLDQLIGPRKAVQIAIFGALVCLVALLGMGREKILFFWSYDPAAHAPLWNGPMFRTLPEAIYLLIGFGVAIFVVAHYASSRTLLTRLARPEKLPAFFGLYAMSGTATVWIGSLFVGIFTAAFGSQQAGFIPIALLLALGLAGMFFVKGGGKGQHRGD